MVFEQAFDPARALRAAFEVLRRAPGPLLVGGLLFFAIEYAAGAPGFQFSGDGTDAAYVAAGAFLAWMTCGGLVLLLLKSWVLASFMKGTRRALREGHCEVADVFSDRDRWFWLALGGFVSGLVTFAAFLPLAGIVFGAMFLHVELGVKEEVATVSGVLAGLFYLPIAIYFAIGLRLTRLAIVFEGLGPIEGMKRSWELSRGNRWLLFVYTLLLALVEFLGLVFCCFPVILASIWTQVAWIDSYLALTQGEKYGSWWIAQEKAVRDAAPRPVGAP